MARELRAASVRPSASAANRESGTAEDGRAEHELVEVARRRLTEELDQLPAWDTPAWWAVVRGPEMGLSLGAHAHYLRLAARRGESARVRELFVLLLERIELSCRRWAAREAGRCGLGHAFTAELREELRQELTLHLWEQLALGHGEAWELFFARSLDFAQRHTAQTYLLRRGLRAKPGVTKPTRAGQRLLVSLAREAGEDDPRGDTAGQPVDGADYFTAAELADLRALVAALPPRERAAVVMRFWQDASEGEMARGLGVSARMVRYYLRRAYTRLRAAYGADGGEAADAR